MKALVCTAYGPVESLQLQDLPSPQPGPGQVLVEVRAAGVNYPDVLIVQGRYQIRPPVPFVPGAEAAGVVRAVGAGVRHLEPGDAVVALSSVGAFAQELVADAARVLPIPAGIDWAVAACTTLVYGTAYHALKDRARLQPGETLLVLGAAGGVGLAAVELGKRMGAQVIAAASSADKLALCRQYGADQVLEYGSGAAGASGGSDAAGATGGGGPGSNGAGAVGAAALRERIKEVAGERRIDVVFDPVGGEFAEPALRSVGWGGRYLVIGFAGGDIPRLPLNLPLLKGSAIVGVYWGDSLKYEPQRALANLQELFAWVAAGTLKPLVSARYPLAEGARALLALQARQVRGKVAILP